MPENNIIPHSPLQKRSWALMSLSSWGRIHCSPLWWNLQLQTSLKPKPVKILWDKSFFMPTGSALVLVGLFFLFSFMHHTPASLQRRRPNCSAPSQAELIKQGQRHGGQRRLCERAGPKQAHTQNERAGETRRGVQGIKGTNRKLESRKKKAWERSQWCRNT